MKIANVILGMGLALSPMYLYKDTFDDDKSRKIRSRSKKFKGYQRENRHFNHKKHK